ncbi:MAG: TrmH family RNA methyltransferase [Acidimicrobiia bacterium]
MITSTSNARISAVRKLHTAKGRKESARTILEGPNGREALAASDLRPTDIFLLEGDTETAAYAANLGIDATVVTQDVLRSASDTQQPLGPLFVIEVPEASAVRHHRTVCMVDVSDPGNVGTIIRTAAALGWDAATHGSTSDPWSPKALRASAGATLRMHLATSHDPIAEAASAGLTCVALIVDGGDVLRGSTDPAFLLVGSEAHGLPDALADAATMAATIPMAAGTESLNAAVAAAIAMHSLA